MVTGNTHHDDGEPPAGEIRPRASSPEELETLFEDTLLLRDDQALSGLFEEGAVLVVNPHRDPCRGRREIARTALARWTGSRSYVADVERIIQARDTALLITASGMNVARRGSDRRWRYAIVVQLDGVEREGDHHDPEHDTNPIAEAPGCAEP
jgi:hypothetical protein